MKIGWYCICLIIGHNKVLYSNHKDEYYAYFTKCSQCEKIWMKEIKHNEKKKSLKIQTISIRGQCKIILIKPRKAIKISNPHKFNFYLL